MNMGTIGLFSEKARLPPCLGPIREKSAGNVPVTLEYNGEKSAILVHVVVIFLVVAGGDVVHPVLIVEIPADGLLDAFLELERGLPTEFALEFAGIDGVAHVVAEAVGDVGDELVAVAFGVTEETVNGLDDDTDDVDVLPFVEATDVIGLGNLAFVEDGVDCTGVVNDIEPVAHVLALSIDRQRFAVTDIVDEQRNELFGELVGTVVVGTVGHDGGHSVCVMIGTDEVVG